MDDSQPTVETMQDFSVREEEVVIVVIVLGVWVAVILLFFNKWGKIRMLEPYLPQYQSDLYGDGLRKSSRVNISVSEVMGVTCTIDRDLHRLSPMIAMAGEPGCSRPRQNSVFVGSPYHRTCLLPETHMSRRVKSAEDIKSLVVQITNHDAESVAV